VVAFILIITICSDMRHHHGCRMVDAGQFATLQECQVALAGWRTDPKFKGKVKYQCALRLSGLGEEQ